MADDQHFWDEYQGVPNPNTTPFPDILLDQVMHRVSPAEWKVLCYIVRRTYGFEKPEGDRISLKQMENGIVARDGRRLDHGTGLSRSGLIKCLAGLEAKRVIEIRKERNEADEAEVNFYRLRRVNSVEGGSALSGPPWSTECTHKKQSCKKQKETESEAPQEAAAPGNGGPQNSGSVLEKTIREAAKAIGRPREARQLLTTAKAEGWDLELVEAAGRVTVEAISSGVEVERPGAYLTTAIRAMLTERREAAEVGQRSAGDRRQQAINYGRQLFTRPIIGGNWRQVESILRESYGAELAAEAVAAASSGG